MKKLKFTSLTAAALATAALATTNLNNHTVKADSVDNQTATKGQTPKEVAQTNVDNAKKDVTSAQNSVDQAQSNLNNAQDQATTAENNYNKQSEAVSAAQKDVNAKSTAVKDAQSKADSAASLANEAQDPSKVKAANDAVSAAEKKVEAAKKEKKSADDAVTAKNNDIKAKSEAVTIAQTAVNSASATSSKADKAVTDAENALKGTGINEAKKALDNATKKLNDDKTALTKAQADQTKQKADYDKAKSEKDSADSALKDAQSKQREASEAYDDIQGKYNKYQETIENDTEKLNQLKENTKNNIVISDIERYKKAYIDYINSSLTDEDINFLAENAGKNNFIKSKNDNREVDINNLSEDDIKDLNLYTADLVSKVRNQFGWDDVEVTKGSIQFTQDILQGYKKDYENGTWDGGWHDSAMINKLSTEYDLPTINDGVNQGYEDMSEKVRHISSTDASDFSDSITINNIKNTIYDSLVGLILPTQEGSVSPTEEKMELDHARGVLGISSSKFVGFADAGKQLFGVAVGDLGSTPVKESESKQSHLEYVNGKWVSVSETVPIYEQTIDTQVRFINVLKSKVGENNTKFDLTPLRSYKEQMSDLTQEIEETTLHINQAEIKAAKQNLDSVTTEVENKNRKVNAANTIVDRAKNNLTQTNNTVAELEDAIQTDTEERDAKQTEYNRLNVNYNELAQKLEIAKAGQTAARDKLNDANIQKQEAVTAFENANKELSTLKDNVTIAENNVKTANKALEDAKQYVTNLNSASGVKQKADADLSKAQEALNEAKSNLKAEQAKLPALENAKQEADNAVVTAQANLDAANTELATDQAKLKDAQDKLESLNKADEVIDSTPVSSLNSGAESTKTDSSKASLVNKDTNSKGTTSSTKEKKKSTKPANKVTLTKDAFVVDKTGKAVTKPKTISKGKHATAIKPVETTINGKKYYQVGKNEYVPAAAVKKVDSKNSSIEVKSKATVVDKNGKVVKSSVSAKDLANDNMLTLVKATPITIKGKKYYEVGENQFLPASAVKKNVARNLQVKLTHNAFVYDKNGKVVKNKLKIKLIRRGKIIKPLNAKVVTIKGKKYYQVGKNQFIKVSNTKIKTNPIKIKAVLKGKKNIKAVDLNGKVNGKTIKAGKKYHFNEKRTIKGKTYYKIAWTNNWVAASKLSVRK